MKLNTVSKAEFSGILVYLLLDATSEIEFDHTNSKCNFLIPCLGFSLLDIFFSS